MQAYSYELKIHVYLINFPLPQQFDSFLFMFECLFACEVRSTVCFNKTAIFFVLSSERSDVSLTVLQKGIKKVEETLKVIQQLSSDSGISSEI